jgi:hypothetical protein
MKTPNDHSIDHFQRLSYVHKNAHFLQMYVLHYATRRKVAGSIPDVIGFFNWPNPSSRIMALESTQNMNFPGGWRAAGA